MNTEEQKVAQLVKNILAEGYTVSVNDGECWVVKKSVNYNEIVAALFSTGADSLAVRTAAGQKVGFIYLVYGNAPDGSEVVNDCSDNTIIQTLCASIGC